MSYLDQPLGQLATQIPGATAIFHKYKLDFCCGGKESRGGGPAPVLSLGGGGVGGGAAPPTGTWRWCSRAMHSIRI